MRDLFAPWHIVIIVLAILILFGGNKIKDSMRSLGEGIREFKKGMKDEDAKKDEPAATKTDDAAKEEKK